MNLVQINISLKSFKLYLIIYEFNFVSFDIDRSNFTSYLSSTLRNPVCNILSTQFGYNKHFSNI